MDGWVGWVVVIAGLSVPVLLFLIAYWLAQICDELSYIRGYLARRDHTGEDDESGAPPIE